MAYAEMEEVARPIMGTAVAFLIITAICSTFEGFGMVLAKGGAVACLVLPPLYYHYSDETKYIYVAPKVQRYSLW